MALHMMSGQEKEEKVYVSEGWQPSWAFNKTRVHSQMYAGLDKTVETP